VPQSGRLACPSATLKSKDGNTLINWRNEMDTYTDMFTEMLKTLDLDDLLSERDLELLRAAEAHHRSELLRGELAMDDCCEQHWNT